MAIIETIKKYWKVIVLTYAGFFLFFMVFPLFYTKEDAGRLGEVIGGYVIPLCLGGYIAYYFIQREKEKKQANPDQETKGFIEWLCEKKGIPIIIFIVILIVITILCLIATRNL